MEILTRVSRSRTFEKQLKKAPRYIQDKVIFWVFLVESSGIREVMKSPGLHDEPLRGERIGQRSVRMNRSYRLIYKELAQQIHIELLEIHKHEY